MIPFAPETAYVVPSAERDSLPHASEGMRQGLTNGFKFFQMFQIQSNCFTLFQFVSICFTWFQKKMSHPHPSASMMFAKQCLHIERECGNPFHVSNNWHFHVGLISISWQPLPVGGAFLRLKKLRSTCQGRHSRKRFWDRCSTKLRCHRSFWESSTAPRTTAGWNVLASSILAAQL